MASFLINRNNNCLFPSICQYCIANTKIVKATQHINNTRSNTLKKIGRNSVRSLGNFIRYFGINFRNILCCNHNTTHICYVRQLIQLKVSTIISNKNTMEYCSSSNEMKLLKAGILCLLTFTIEMRLTRSFH